MAGIYVHIPFCKSRCKYCDFFSTIQLERRHEYVDALLAEWEEWKINSNLWNNPRTLYFGGGTPSLLETNDIHRIISSILPSDFSKDVEVTLEANPGDLSLEKLQALRSCGVNRLSIGIQSFNNHLLHTIGRRHNATDAMQAVRNAQEAGFDNISIDLIYGLPGETMEIWDQDINQALELKVQHISCYCLSYEENTPLSQMLVRGEIQETNEDELNRMYDYLCAKLSANGIFQYEVSNFATKNKHSQHNSSYWNSTPYLGLGAGAHSFDGIKRWWNPDNLDMYIDGIRSHSLLREEEVLTPEQHHMEKVMLGLRTTAGIDCQEVAFDKAMSMVKMGWLRKDNGRWIATQDGIHVLNQIINNLL